ncbi:MAG: FAD-binding protein [Symbiobacteriaceae bacterium]|nr:FAD-binding protein [Symbiobacteriaceae bacterium]
MGSINQKFDVIVIGSGGAGLVAALEANDLGASVLVVSKAPLGLNNCTTYAGGGFSYAGPGGSKEDHRQRTAEIGRQIGDTALQQVFSLEGPEAVAALRNWGVQLREHPGGGSVTQGSPLPGVGGLGMTYPLVQELHRRQLPALEEWMVAQILCDERGVTGIEVINLKNGERATISCSALIVATGGGGRIYGRTNNPGGTTGDGYHLLHQVGCTFRDMEFVQFYPIGLAEPELPLWFIDLSIIDRVPLVNSAGQEFLLAQLKEWGLANGREGNLYARDRCSISIFQQYYQGDTALLHLEQLSEEDWQRGQMSRILRLNRPGSFDFTQQGVRVKPLQHYMCGGVVIDTQGATAVPGLYACGEVTGGVDGANRIGGNALTNITLFGKRAAAGAVSYAREAVPAKEAVGGGHPLHLKWQANSQGVSPVKLRLQLQETMDLYVAPLRDASGLNKALAILEEIRNEMPSIYLKDNRDLREALELQGLVTTAELVTKAALMRTESRGVHFRWDYPEENPSWAKAIFVR